MIERFALKADVAEIAEKFNVVRIEHSQDKRYNVAPTQQVTVVMNDRHDNRIVQEARWGMFPFWAKDSINTSKSSIRTKPFLYDLARRSRCVIPCTGFYGSRSNGKERDPRTMHVVMPNQPLFGIAGIFDCFRNPEGHEVRVFTMLTEETVGHMADWQPTLPIVLDQECIEAWLQPSERNYERLQHYLPRLESYQLQAYPVTNDVKDEQYDSPDCIRELKIDFA